MTKQECEEEWAKYEYDEDIIDRIYNDFESRTCENCIYLGTDKYASGLLDCNLLTIIDFYKLKDFGCNKFERKN